ncbi:MAG: DUF3991 and toprim domain-containing protein, partial [Eubacterium sp.]|nr:DUF3991 and toprim domain-containing protein [Eubacterium sp.]
MGKGYKYNNEQWRAITNADCVEVARALGYEFDEKRSDKTSLRIKDNGGMFVLRNGKGWCQHSTGAQGHAVDLVMYSTNRNYKEAMEFIFENVLGRSDYELNRQVHQEYSQYIKAQQSTPEFKLPERAANHRRVIAYLMKTRCIAKEVIISALDNRSLYQDAQHGNCCFVGFDKEGVPRFCSKRSTASDIQFRGDVAGSDKSYSWKIEGSLAADARLYIFEAPIDAMSHATLNQIMGRDWKTDTRLAMGGCSMLPVEQHLKDNPSKYREIVICTDNDEKGHKMANIISEQLGGGYKVTRRCSFGKDWNEDLVDICKGAEEMGVDLRTAI